jgi:hypothetical protein
MTTTERIAEIRKQLKEAFKGYKFSVVKRHYNGVDIAVLSAPYPMTDAQHQTVNPYYIRESFEGRTQEDLLKIREIAYSGVTYRETGDYGSQPDLYIDISIGKWNRPFQVN